MVGRKSGSPDLRDTKLPISGKAGIGARHFVLVVAALLATASTQNIQAAGNKAFGEYLSSECVTCHQVSGRYEGIPPIVGWPEESFIAIMKQYRIKERANPVMQTIAGKLSEEEIAALAAYFGSLKPAPRAR
jgi:cytochrome c553